jgi:hypothetical protein
MLRGSRLAVCGVKGSRLAVWSVAAVCVVLGVLAGAVPAGAVEPWWHVTGQVTPTYLPPGGEGTIYVQAMNLGDAAVNLPATPVTLVDKLPAGLKAVQIERSGTGGDLLWSEGQCSLEQVSCTFNGYKATENLNGEVIPLTLTVPPFYQVGMEIEVKAEAGASSGENVMSVSGGGAVPVSAEQRVTVSSAPVPFGVESYEFTPVLEGGAPDTQAGSHPFELTSTLQFNTTALPDTFEGFFSSAKTYPFPVALPKDLHFVLPAGVVGNPTPIPQCTEAQFNTDEGGQNACPADTAIGGTQVKIANPGTQAGFFTLAQPLFNLVPARGEPARFGFYIGGNTPVPVFLDTAVRTGGGYNVEVNVNNISQLTDFISSEVTLWGVPGDASHDSARGWSCLEHVGSEPCQPLGDQHPAPFLMLPTSCTGPLQTTIQVDSWVQPGAFTQPLEPLSDESLDGCNRLSFEPEIVVTPDGQAASTPTGLTVDVHVPQSESLVGNGLAQATVKETTVALPAGVALNPSGADGLLACSTAQIALTSPFAGSCPDASKIGTVEIKTPLLPEPLEGAVYLAAQDENPFGSLIAMYLFAEDPQAGLVVKLAGQVTPNPVNGQLVATFKETPQVPFEDLKLHFFGGSRAPLGTPALCGSYATRASIVPWSGNPPVESSSVFQVDAGPSGTPCSNPLPFAPSLETGSLNLQASGFTPFTLTMSREDGNQNLQGLQVTLPSGVLGDLSNVTLCGEPQAQEGTCGPESLIGETVVSVGFGPNPYTVFGGKVFITGPYGNAPYGLSITNPAKAGPFDLEQGTACDCLVVRAGINVNPRTAGLSITAYPLPTILQGVPLDIRHVNVTINRPDFTFNPSDCAPQEIGGGISSVEGSFKPLAVPFQVTNCATLAFKPKFSVTTSGHTSKANGASLSVKLFYASAPQGTQTNIAKVKVELPKELPSRLTTLQKACAAVVFERNPSECPAASIIGHARASTPVLPDELAGPAYFVSYGSAKFPELVVVLQADRVRVDLHGETFISKTGITSSTFTTIPDVPIGTFELLLPEGPYSALAANGSLCGDSLSMPTEFVAKNGAEIHQTTKIGVTGCAKKTAKKASHARKSSRARKSSQARKSSRAGKFSRARKARARRSRAHRARTAGRHGQGRHKS